MANVRTQIANIQVVQDQITGAILVSVTGAGSGGTSSVDESTFEAGVTAGTPAMAEDPATSENLILQTIPSSRILKVAGAKDGDSFTAGSSTGMPLQAYDPTSGELLNAQMVAGSRVLEVGGSFSISPTESSTCSTNALNAIGNTSTQVLASNSSRKRAILQNLSTLPAYVLLGSGTASLANFTFALPACGTSKDGSSPIQYDIMWQGAVQVIYGSAGGLFNAQENT